MLRVQTNMPALRLSTAFELCDPSQAGSPATSRLPYIPCTGIWTEALTSVLGMPGKSAAEVFRTVYSDAAAFQHAKALGICLLGTNAFRGVNAKNKFASDLWDGRGWVSWTKERDMYLASVRAGKQTS